MRVLFRCEVAASAFDQQTHRMKIPIGLFVEPVEVTSTDVVVIDLSNGCLFSLTRRDFDTHFERWR